MSLLGKIRIYYDWYMTKRSFCPYCGKKTPMINYASGIVPDALFPGMCWTCESKWRTRFMYYIFEMLFLNRKDTYSVLHTAPELAIARLLSQKKNIEYFPVDINPSRYPNILCDYADIMNLKYESSSFDYIISSQVLEHVPNDFQALREFKRVLKPGGVVILCLPVGKNDITIDEYCNSIANPNLPWDNHQDLSEQERWKRFGQEDHVRLYGKDTSERLASQGFIVNEIIPENFLSDKVLNSLGNRGVLPSSNPWGIHTNYFYLLFPK